MPHDDLRPVLHGLRLVGFASVEVLSLRVGRGTVEVETLLQVASAQGWTTFRDGRMTGWSLTANGRSYGESLLAAELDAAMRRGAVQALYEQFLVLNPVFLELCTDWQLRPASHGQGTANGGSTVNDHSDADYDRSVLDRLGALDEGIQPLVARLAGELARFGAYGSRLAAARASLEEGHLDWFTRPTLDSYHTVWFELHEDLLATLGLDRTHEH